MSLSATARLLIEHASQVRGMTVSATVVKLQLWEPLGAALKLANGRKTQGNNEQLYGVHVCTMHRYQPI